MTSVAALLHKLPESLRVLRISIDDQVTLRSKRPALLVDQVATNLQHPRFIRLRRDTRDMHDPVGKTDHE